MHLLRDNSFHLNSNTMKSAGSVVIDVLRVTHQYSVVIPQLLKSRSSKEPIFKVWTQGLCIEHMQSFQALYDSKDKGIACLQPLAYLLVILHASCPHYLF